MREKKLMQSVFIALIFAFTLGVVSVPKEIVLANPGAVQINKRVGYPGIPSGTTEVALPYAVKKFNNEITEIWVQAVGANTTSGSIVFSDGSGYGFDIDPGYSLHVNLNEWGTMPYGFEGTAIVSANNDIAVVYSLYSENQFQPDIRYVAPGLDVDGLSTRLISTSNFHQAENGLDTRFTLYNYGNTSTSYDLNYYENDGSPVASSSGSLSPGEQLEHYPIHPPAGYEGYLEIETDQPSVIAHSLNYDLDAQNPIATAAYNAITCSDEDGQQSYNRILPYAISNHFTNEYTTLNIVNTSTIQSTAVFTATYYQRDGSFSGQVVDILPNNGRKSIASETLPFLKSTWEGSVIIEATHPIAIDASYRQFGEFFFVNDYYYSDCFLSSPSNDNRLNFPWVDSDTILFLYNPGDVAATIGIGYYGNVTGTSANTVGPGKVVSIQTPLPNFFGAALISSDNPIMGLAILKDDISVKNIYLPSLFR